MKPVAEQRTLLNRIVQGDVRRWQRIEPARGHVALRTRAIIGFQERHGKGFHLQCRVAQWTLAHELREIPVDKEEVDTCRVGHEHRTSRPCSKPRDIAPQGGVRRFESLATGFPGRWLGGPPSGGFRMRRCTGERFKIGAEGRDQWLIGGVGRRTPAEQGMRSGNRAIGFNVGADREFGHFIASRVWPHGFRDVLGPACGYDPPAR